jgi:hypothetical protein
MALLPSSRWRATSWYYCPCRNGIDVIINVVALIAHCQAGIIALIVMALLPLMHKRLCHCCDGDCRSCHDGIIAVVNTQVSLLLSS